MSRNTLIRLFKKKNMNFVINVVFFRLLLPSRALYKYLFHCLILILNHHWDFTSLFMFCCCFHILSRYFPFEWIMAHFFFSFFLSFFLIRSQNRSDCHIYHFISFQFIFFVLLFLFYDQSCPKKINGSGVEIFLAQNRLTHSCNLSQHSNENWAEIFSPEIGQRSILGLQCNTKWANYALHLKIHFGPNRISFCRIWEFEANFI